MERIRKAIIKIWKEDLSFSQAYKELSKNNQKKEDHVTNKGNHFLEIMRTEIKNPNTIILYVVILFAIIIGYLI